MLPRVMSEDSPKAERSGGGGEPALCLFPKLHPGVPGPRLPLLVQLFFLKSVPVSSRPDHDGGNSTVTSGRGEGTF